MRDPACCLGPARHGDCDLIFVCLPGVPSLVYPSYDLRKVINGKDLKYCVFIIF